MTKKKDYYIVNPAGAVHGVDYQHARARLRQVGYRQATETEVEEYMERQVQRFDDPIAAPWNPEPEPEPELGEDQDEGEGQDDE